jgi:LysM repeat protein
MPRRDRRWQPTIWTFVAPGALVVAVIVVSVVLVSTLHARSGSSAPATTVATPTSVDTPGSSTVTPTSYTIRPGDTLGGIAKRLGISLDAIIALNPKLDPQHLRPGAVLALP